MPTLDEVETAGIDQLRGWWQQLLLAGRPFSGEEQRAKARIMNRIFFRMEDDWRPGYDWRAE